MTKTDIEHIRSDACKLIIFSIVSEIGSLHGRNMNFTRIEKALAKVRDDLFGVLAQESELNKEELEFTSSCMNNVLSIFESMLLFKEGPNVLDLLYAGLRAQIKEGSNG